VPVRAGQEPEAALVAHDGDGRVGQAGEVTRQVADVRPAAVLVVGEVAHVVEPVLDVRVVSDKVRDLRGAGLAWAERGDPVGGPGCRRPA